MKVGVLDHFMGKKRVDNAKFKTNLTFQAVSMDKEISKHLTRKK
jgi:hypothetical protein